MKKKCRISWASIRKWTKKRIFHWTFQRKRSYSSNRVSESVTIRFPSIRVSRKTWCDFAWKQRCRTWILLKRVRAWRTMRSAIRLRICESKLRLLDSVPCLRSRWKSRISATCVCRISLWATCTIRNSIDSRSQSIRFPSCFRMSVSLSQLKSKASMITAHPIR